MTRNELKRYLGKCVTITLLDNTVIEGTLHKTGEKAFENNPNLSIPVNFYFCTDVNNKVVKNTAYKMVRQKGFPSIKVGNRYVVRESSLEKWIETNEGREFILLERKI